MSDAQFPPRPTALAQEMLRPLVFEGDLVIDATAGNGHDTLFLAECVGVSGRVLAFDVQAAALAAAGRLLGGAGLAERVSFFHESHGRMEERAAAGSVAAVMFNLGYLPGEDHALTTEADETLAALESAARLLKSGGVLSVVCYPGHPAGAVEAKAVEQWMAGKTADGWRVARYGALGTRRPAPFLLLGGRGVRLR
ncbi:class I SAM-dependent methyltransferase [Luteolibacter yonseiensis]|uniref:Class I SAM-dependent methyltransferase n=1 Tax=Luteolibacter yonseiensis TaxID=1144680 RepID=A0A934R888_9BACT|nr:class I SAM-dependent methyltransferase [Luteolibacter yonseiensis]MBK1816904.1 class I SAM-dependent methyltransferase [Luteolibacter yonseiensis]